MDATPLYDLAPLARMALLGSAIALGPLGWWWLRQRGATPAARLRALTLLTLFLTFDLVIFGAFTRLSDSGLGCPDWPGCYGSATPLGAQAAIETAQTALPSGPVTHGKAWVEMVHRYLATAVGVLIAVIAAASVWQRRRGDANAAPGWALSTLLWVCLQGAFGALTVTMKLYPAIVTVHLLGGLGLLALLAVQTELRRAVPLPLALPRSLRLGVALVAALALLQIALGGWVSTNYAVLACRDFPTCQGAWWPAMDFAQGFTIVRELGAGRGGGWLPFTALTAIHVAHRAGAAIVLAALAWLAWRLAASGIAAQRRWAAALVGVTVWQAASGISNVVLGWPLAAALAHTAGAAALVVLLTVMLTRVRHSRTVTGAAARQDERKAPARAARAAS